MGRDINDSLGKQVDVCSCPAIGSVNACAPYVHIIMCMHLCPCIYVSACMFVLVSWGCYNKIDIYFSVMESKSTR